MKRQTIRLVVLFALLASTLSLAIYRIGYHVPPVGVTHPVP
jgi:hypothetical protein